MLQRPGQRARRRRRASGVAVAALGCLGLACWTRSGGRWLPASGPAQAVQAAVPVREASAASAAGGVSQGALASDDPPERGSCEAALAEGYQAFLPMRTAWSTASQGGQPLRDFRRQAAVAQRRALARFDAELESSPETCGPSRSTLEAMVVREAWKVFLVQRRLLEETVADSLSDQLLRRTRRRKGPLRVQEKLDLLQKAIASYSAGVGRMRPELLSEASEDGPGSSRGEPAQGEPEQAEVERRLGELQFEVELSADGRAVLGDLEQQRQRQLLRRRASGVSVSLDPGLRVMVRPEGLGNLQVFSEGPVGPARVNVGVMNDGLIADVYREHPVPPKISLQPAVRVNLNLG